MCTHRERILCDDEKRGRRLKGLSVTQRSKVYSPKGLYNAYKKKELRRSWRGRIITTVRPLQHCPLHSLVTGSLIHIILYIF